MTLPQLFTFSAGKSGAWAIERISAVRGDALELAERLEVSAGPGGDAASVWQLRGVTSNDRYTTRAELADLVALQEPLGRHAATCAALIPVRKSAHWWQLAQDERRQILEERSRHIATGIEYLPAVARRLHHSRDLGEPFDFLTWFEFAPADARAFEQLVDRLRSTEEWDYVERELDICLKRI